MKIPCLLLMTFGIIGVPALLNAQQTYNVNVHQVESWQYGGQAYTEHMQKLRDQYAAEDRADQAAESRKKIADLQAEKLDLENEKARLENEKLKKEIQNLDNKAKETSNAVSTSQEPKGDILGAQKGAEAFPERFTCVCTTNFTVADMTFHQGDVVFTQKDTSVRL